MVCRVKVKLKLGKILVTDNQWPIFPYTGYSYDPEDPWNGLLQSSLLVRVSHFFYMTSFIWYLILNDFRPSNMFSHCQAQYTRSQRPLSPETLVFMV
jgi:hypothetical protein